MNKIYALYQTKNLLSSQSSNNKLLRFYFSKKEPPAPTTDKIEQNRESMKTIPATMRKEEKIKQMLNQYMPEKTLRTHVNQKLKENSVKKEKEKENVGKLKFKKNSNNLRQQYFVSGLVDKFNDEDMKRNIISTFNEIVGYAGGIHSLGSNKSIQIRRDYTYFAFFDGCSKSNPGPSGAGYFLATKNSKQIFKNSVNLGVKTNNQAEFMALLLCLIDCKINNVQNLTIFGDSLLAIKGINGDYNIQDSKLKYINILNRYLKETFSKFQAIQIDRKDNKIADKLSNEALKKPFLLNNND